MRGSKSTYACALSLAIACLGPIANAQLVVNEIDYDQAGSDTAEFLELKNTSGSNVDLSAFDVVLVNGSNGSIYQTISLPAVSLAAGDYYVLCADAATVGNCDLDVLNSIQNGAPDAVAVVAGATIIDTVSYEGDTIAPYTETSGAGLIDIGSAEFNFSGISRFPDGADTDINNADLSVRCITPGAANGSANSACPEPPTEGFVINEFDYVQPGGDSSEFVELLVTGNQSVNLGDHSLELIDGATGTAYATIALAPGTLAGGSYYVVCNNAAVTVNCDQIVTPAVGFLQNGAPDAIALVNNGSIVDTVSYAGNSPAPYTETSGTASDNPTEDDLGLSRIPNGSDNDNNAGDFSARCITPGAANTSVGAPCGGGPATEIFAIQGSGIASLLAGQVVTSEDNIVTAVTPDGFYMQTPTARSDGDDTTSDGIFVFTGAAPAVAVGDQVDVTGMVDEFFDFTEITNSPLVSVDSSGNVLPAAVVLDENTPSPLQPQSAIEMERFEGMVVSANGIATGGTDRFGDTPMVASSNRTFREPGVEYPGTPGLPVWDGNPELFELNADGAGLADTGVFGGQSILAEGPLGFSFGDFQIVPTSLTLGSTSGLPRAVRAAAPGELTIASQNMLRLFDTVDDPLTDDPLTPPAEYAIRLAKFSFHARVTLGAPDIIALQEVENLVVVQDMANTINADDPALVYSAHLIDGNDVGGIDVAYLTRDATVTVTGVTALGSSEILAFDGSLLNDRPPLQLDAQYSNGGASTAVTIINVHQRSLGGIDGSESARVRTKRFEQSTSLANKVQALQTATPDINLVVIGDFNAFEFTDGYVDVMGQITGAPDPLGAEFAYVDIVDPALDNQVLTAPADDRYSFVFSGSAQVLDHALSSSAMAAATRGLQFSRGNADAPNTLFLAEGPDLGLRIADHDGLVLYIMTDSDGDSVLDDMDNCTLANNPSQLDSNGDGFGNACDPDIDNNGVVNVVDLGIFRVAFFSNPASPNWNADADFNGDGVINVIDLGILRSLFFRPPGPSGIL